MIHDVLKAQRDFEEQSTNSVQLGVEAFAYFCEWIGCVTPSRKIRYHGILFVRNELLMPRSIVGCGKECSDLVRNLEESFNKQ